MTTVSKDLVRSIFRMLEPSATLAINEQSAALQALGRRPVKLGLGQSPFPVPEHVVDRLKDAAAEKDYLPVQGLMSLRRSICDWHKRTHGLSFKPEQIIIGPGSKELLYLLQLVSETETYLPSPSWVSYAPQQQITGRKARWVATDANSHFMLTAQQLEHALLGCDHRPLLILNSPSNPVGRMLPNHELAGIAEVVKQQGGIILSDEIYGGVAFGATHISPAHHYPEGTIISGGLSKWCGAGGWRLGYMAVPDTLTPILQAMCAAASETFTSVSAPIQYAAIAAYEPNELTDDYLHHSQRVLRLILNDFQQALARFKIHAPVPQGGFYLFADFSAHRNELLDRGIVDDQTLCAHLLEHAGVAMLPGQCFGRNPTELLARMSIVDFDGTHALKMSKATKDDDMLSRMLAQQSPELMGAPQKMGQWLSC
jgi:aspartate aminotransferase